MRLVIKNPLYYPPNQTFCSMMNERIRAIMTRNVVTVAPSQSVADAYLIIKEKRFHHIPVVEGTKLVGIITSYDLMQMEVCPEEYGAHTIADVMTSQVAYLNPDDLVGAAAEVFMEHLFHGLPICDDDHNLVGIITTHDVLKYNYYKAYPSERPERFPLVHS